MRTSRATAIAAVTAGLMGGLAPGTHPMAAGADSPAEAITIQTFQFQPARLEVTPGSSVTCARIRYGRPGSLRNSVTGTNTIPAR